VVGVLLVVLATMNCLLIRQNLQLRAALGRTEPQRLKSGDVLEPFTATGLHNEKIDVNYAKNSPRRILMFFSTQCPYSREQFAYWDKVIRSAPTSGIEVLALTQDWEDKTRIEEFLKAVGCPPESKAFQVGLINDETRKKYKFTTTPTTLVVSSGGVSEYVWGGKWTDRELTTATASLGFNVSD